MVREDKQSTEENFITPSTLAKVRRMWQMWYIDDWSVEVIRTGGMDMMIKEIESEHIKIHLVRCFGTYIQISHVISSRYKG